MSSSAGELVIRVLASFVRALMLLLLRLQEMLQNVDGQRENDGRILLCRDRVERLKVAQLQVEKQEKKTKRDIPVHNKKKSSF